MSENRLGRFGIRDRRFGVAELDEAVDAAIEVEELGFGTLWVNAPVMLERGEALAAATEHLVIASSVASIWIYDPHELAREHRALAGKYPGRFLLGVGASHKPIVEQTAPGREYAKPVTALRSWLADVDVPVEDRIVAAIWPRSLGVARDMASGAHPYLVPAEHTRSARKVLGPDRLLAPAHVVVVNSDAEQARALGRRHLNDPYSTLPNYYNNWLRHGFDEDDLADGGSDRLIDALVAWGDPATVAGKLQEHFTAGADHVGLHLVTADQDRFPRVQWRELADALGATSDRRLDLSGSGPR